MNIGYNDDCMKGIKTDSSTFEDFVKNDDILYVDKTEYTYRLVSNKPDKRFFFVSRPRRYGKSLFCSMLHAIFDGRKELFKDLYIGKTDYPFEKYPVIHINFGIIGIATFDTFYSSFVSVLLRCAEEHDVSISGNSPSDLLAALLQELVKKTGKPVVIIIDEYDRPFTSKENGSSEFFTSVRSVLNDFYSVIKNQSRYVRFFFITGVVKLANLSIFSAMNNLTDLSMLPEFASAFGYTEGELEEYFGEGIDEYVEAHPDVKRNDFKARIKAYYDGYRFSPRSEITVYNPVSVGTFFSQGCYFQNYWEMTGVSTLAVNLAKRNNLSGLLDDTLFLDISSFYSFDVTSLGYGKLDRNETLALLYYAGYLTISDYDDPIIYLRFPNSEVAGSFSRNLLARYLKDRDDEISYWVKMFRKSCKAGDMEDMRKKIEEYFESFSYDLIGKEQEKFYHSIFHAIFVMAGMQGISEERTLRGRSDEVVIAGDNIYVFELKVDRSADDALGQIEEKGYAEKYLPMKSEGMNVFGVGVSFSSEMRKVIDWKCKAF